MSKQYIICKNVLSLLDHTRVGLAFYSGRKARGCSNARYTPCELRRSAAALRALLRFRSARGAICAHSLTSELADSFRLIIENMLKAAENQAQPKAA